MSIGDVLVFNLYCSFLFCMLQKYLYVHCVSSSIFHHFVLALTGELSDGFCMGEHYPYPLLLIVIFSRATWKLAATGKTVVYILFLTINHQSQNSCSCCMFVYEKIRKSGVVSQE